MELFNSDGRKHETMNAWQKNPVPSCCWARLGKKEGQDWQKPFVTSQCQHCQHGEA